MTATLEKALSAKRESKYVEFKEQFDPSETKNWVEILKDLVAMANSGGGVILFGVTNKGEPASDPPTSVLDLDHAKVVDQIHRYTDTHFSDFELVDAQKSGRQVAALVVRPAPIPIVFTRPGTYPGKKPGKQETAFGKGTAYFRHGAKSEPGSTEDISRSVERRLENILREWIGGVKRVVQAPAGSQVAVLLPEVRESESPDAMPIRLTTDPSAAPYRVVDPDKTHPYRGKEIVPKVQDSLPPGVTFNSHDLLAVRVVNTLDERHDFIHHPKFGSRQYSAVFAAWVAEQVANDPEFLTKARHRYRETVFPQLSERISPPTIPRDQALRLSSLLPQE